MGLNQMIQETLSQYIASYVASYCPAGSSTENILRGRTTSIVSYALNL